MPQGTDDATQEQTDQRVVRRGTRCGYGSWLDPILTSNQMDASVNEKDSPGAKDQRAPRRGRGRPRVPELRNPSAIEKRRAQVREAQRTYQKRKDSAAASERGRCDELLVVLSDISSHVESLLRAASKAGILDQDDDVATHVRSLWTAYDEAVNSKAVQPELRLLKLKNEQRRADHRDNDNFRIAATSSSAQTETLLSRGPGDTTDRPIDISSVDLDLLRVNDTTVCQPFSAISSRSKIMAGRSIFDVVSERQAEFRKSERAPSW